MLRAGLSQPAAPLRNKIIAPRRKAFAGTGGKFKDLGDGARLADVAQSGLAVKPGSRLEVCLRDDDDVGRVKHRRVLQWFVFTFGNREEHHTQGFTEIKGSGANQIADVFDHQQIHRAEIQAFHRFRHHAGFEVAESAGRDLDDGSAGGPEPGRVVVGGEVAHYDPRSQLAAQGSEGGLQQRRFPRTGGGNDIESQHIQREPGASIPLREPVVPIQEGRIHIYNLTFMVVPMTVFMMIVSMTVLMVVLMAVTVLVQMLAVMGV